MASGETVDDVIRRIITILNAASVPYMLTGSFASSLHGIPRATQDIDLVIAPNPASFEALLKNFPDDQHYVSREAAFDAYQRSSLFNVIEFASGWKIDFIVRKPRDFSRVEFDRRAPANVLGTTVFVASPEDVLISKLEWAKLAESERQIEDTAGIIRTQGHDPTPPTSSIGPRSSGSRHSGTWRKQRRADYRATSPIETESQRRGTASHSS